MSRSVAIAEAGIQATVQDYPGRRGMQAQGFFPAGPMDHLAHRAANLLVGNPVSAATLEITLGNFRARLDADATIAVCGAEAPVTVDGTEVAVWESHHVPAGAELAIGIAPGAGFRFYLAVDGGFDVPLLFGSRATYTMGALGGLEGRPLQQGDRLPLGEPGDHAGRRLAPGVRPEYSREWEVRVMRGPQAAPDYLTEGDLDTLFGRPWPVDRNSNRTGIRLESHKFEWARRSGGIAAATRRTSWTTAIPSARSTSTAISPSSSGRTGRPRAASWSPPPSPTPTSGRSASSGPSATRCASRRCRSSRRSRPTGLSTRA
jgi:urea carboxylase